MAGTKKGTPRKASKNRPRVGTLVSKGGGRQAWKLGDSDRELIKSLAGRGLAAEHIAVHLKVDKKTLLKYACDEIEAGRALGIASVTGVLYKEAMKGSFKHAAYYLNNVDRENWSTTKKLEHSGAVTLEQLITGEGLDE